MNAERSCSKRSLQQQSRVEWSRTAGVRSRGKAARERSPGKITRVQSRQSCKSAEHKQTENTRKDRAREGRHRQGDRDRTKYRQEPEVVKNLSNGIITTTSISLSWEKPDGNASSYEIQILENPTFNKIVTSTSDTIDGLTPGNYYTLLVTAVFGENNVTGNSSEISVYTKPDLVKNLMTGSITTTSISVIWEKPDGNTSSYEIQILGDPSFNKTVTSTSDTIEGLTPGNYYTLLVSAVVGDNNVTGNSSEISVYTKPEVVENLMSGVITTTSISLSWAKPDGNASSYEIQILGDPTFNKTVATTSATIEGLTPGNYYTLLVSAVVGENNVTGNSSAISAYSRPATVIDLQSSTINSSTIYVSWLLPEGNRSSYLVEVIGDPPQSFIVYSESATINFLTSGSQYTVRISAEVGNGLLGDGKEISVLDNITATLITTTSVQLNWNPDAGENTTYSISVYGEPSSTWTVNTTAIQITNLTSGNFYKIWVSAYMNNLLLYGYGGEISLYTRPGVVRNIQADNITTNSMTISWFPPESNYSHYLIEVTGDIYLNETTTSGSLPVSGLAPGNQYTVTIRAVTGEDVSGDPAKFIVTTKPEVVKNFMTGVITTTSISLSWEKPDGNASSYEIQILGEPTFNKSVTSTSDTIEGLTPGNYYTLLVTAVVGENYVTGNSSEISVYTKPEVVKNLMTRNITTTSISLSWAKPDGNASSYEIQILGEPTFNKTVTSASDTIEGLTPGNYYTLLVTAVVGENNVTGNSTEISVYTKPEVVKNLMTGIITTTSISLSWAKPDGNASSYEIQILGEPTFNKTVTSTSDTIEGLTPGNYYTLLVTAVVGENNVTGISSDVSVYTSEYYLYSDFKMLYIEHTEYSYSRLIQADIEVNQRFIDCSSKVCCLGFFNL
ncbi:unnamed protein product, partial [Ranitomeya imitator]